MLKANRFLQYSHAFFGFLVVLFLSTNFWPNIIYAGGTEGFKESLEGYINPVWSPDGTFLLLTDKNSNGVYVYDTNDSSLFQITDAPGSGYKYHWTSDSKKVGFKLLVKTDGSYTQLPAIFDLNKKEILPLFNAVRKAGVPSFSKDGQIAFTIGEELIILNEDGNLKNKINLGNYANLTPISPDGSKVVYNDEHDQMWLIHSDGSNRRQITSEGPGYFNPVWSPDSTKIVMSTLSGELKVRDIVNNKIFDLDKGNNPSWSPDSQYILYSKVESMVGSEITNTGIWLIGYDGSEKNLLTNQNELIGHANLSPDGGKIVLSSYIAGDLFWATMFKSVSTAITMSGFAEKIEYSSFKKWEGEISSFVEKQTANAELSEYLVSSSTISISGVPYISQLYDTPDWFDGSLACNATSALMVITYYGLLPEWNTTVSIPYSHISPYGRYISDIYSYRGYTYNIGAPDGSGTTAYGGFGYIARDDAFNQDTIRFHLTDYLLNHGLTSSLEDSPSWAKLQNEINAGYPIILRTLLSPSGHYVVGIGYYPDQRTVIVNDPSGNKNQVHPNYNGAGVSYDWPGYNNGYTNLNAVYNFIYARGACTYSISPVSNAFGPGAGSGSVNVTTGPNCSWTASTNSGSWDWIGISSGWSGKGNGTVNYFLLANNTGLTRTGTLTIAGQTFTITQQGQQGACTYSISSASNTLGPGAGSGSVSVTTGTNCSWTASTNSGSWDWIAITSGWSGTGNGQVNYLVLPNNTGSSRSGYLTIAGQTFTITQQAQQGACTYSISPTSNTFGPDAGSGSVNVTAPSGCSWTASTNSGSWDWIAITSGWSGTGSGSVNYIVLPNSTGSTRSGFLTIAGQTFNITQQAQQGACTYSISPTSNTFGPDAGSGSVNVTAPSGCSWTASTNSGSWDWIAITSGWSGTGSDTVNYSVLANNTGSTRSGFLTIAGQTFNVTQSASPTPPEQKPNLTPYQPRGWSDKLVVSNKTGCTSTTCTDSSPLLPTDTLYVSYTVINNGSVATSTAFTVQLYLDNALIRTGHPAPPLNPNHYSYVVDYSIGSLSVGTHTLNLVVDSKPGVIDESNENDNQYTKTITISASP